MLPSPHPIERIECTNGKQPKTVSMHRIVRWQQELHEFAQHLEEIIHEEDEPLHTFYLSQFHQHQKPTSISAATALSSRITIPV